MPPNPILAKRPGLFGRNRWNAMESSEMGMGASASALPMLDAARNAQGKWSIDPQGETLGAGVERAQPAPAIGQTGLLGNSARQPFDFEAAKARLAGDQKKIPDWKYVAAAFADAMTSIGSNMSGSGAQPMALRGLMGLRQDQRDRMAKAEELVTGWQENQHARNHAADLQASNPFTIGRSRVAYDPVSGQANVLYDGEEDFELYAKQMGLKDGSQEYFDAVEDFVLRGSGPSAHMRDIELDGVRTDNDRGLEAYRQSNRVDLENRRQRGRQSMEDARQSNRMTLRQTPSAGRAGGGKRTATDGRGRKMEWNGTAWVFVK